MQQQPPPPTLKSGSFPSPPVTTEQIQKYLEENKNLIMAILENQNLGKLAECGQLQALLQKNLMYLAAIADAQPPPSGPQVPPNSVAQQGNYMQQPQGAIPQQQSQGAMPQQPQQGGGVPKLPFQLNAQQQQQLLHFQQQQQMHGQMGPRPGGVNNGMHGMHQVLQHGMQATSGGMVDARGNRQDVSEAASGDGQGKSASGRSSGNRES